MRKKVDNIWEKACLTAISLVIGAGAAWGCWRDAQPKFQNVSIDVGETSLQVGQFLTEYAVPEKTVSLTNLESIDLDRAGEHAVVLTYGEREETVFLTIEDNVAPELAVQDLVLAAGSEFTAEDFVTHLSDQSEVSVAFAEEPVIPRNYSDITVQIVATDSQGNQTTAQSSVSFTWLRDEVYLEYGNALTPADLLYDPEKDTNALDAADLETISASPIGEYMITANIGATRADCKVIVQDTLGPELTLKEHQIYLGTWYYTPRLSDFVVSAADASGDVTLRMLTTEFDWTVEGSQTIVIEAEDIHGNVTTGETTFYVVTDTVAPVIGKMEELVVEKYGIPDYMTGVAAEDVKDGPVDVTCDYSMLDTSVPGTYYITYTAKDSSGNSASARRKVTVNPDESDILALVEPIAAELEDDPELIRDYVRSQIYYSSDWGGDYPVWFGFTTRSGNCYVHALCLKAILDLKGYNTQLIWVTDKTHYWLIIEMEDGVWRHIDATPSELHSMYSLMTDDLRWLTLSGRDWDRTLWPACE